MNMIDLKDKNVVPTLEELGQAVKNPVFLQFCSEIKDTWKCKEAIEYSSCSWEPGWNVKFRKSGKTLCTIYPRECYFTVMIVINKNQKEAVEEILPGCSPELQERYDQTTEGNGQRWLMIDLEDKDALYHDVLSLIQIRRSR